MSKKTESVIEVFPGFAAGEMMAFDSIAQVAALEEWLPSVLDPTLDEARSPSHAEAWAGRIALVDILRPQDFHGNIVDITLTVKGSAYADLKSASSSHVSFALGGATRIPRTDIDPNAYLGFDFSGHLESTGTGKISPITSELWYVRLPDNRVVDNFGTDGMYRDYVHSADSMINPDSMMRVRRIITRSKYDRDAIKKAKDGSASRSQMTPDASLKVHA